MRKRTRYLLGTIILGAAILGAGLVAATDSLAYGAFAMGRNNSGGWWYGVSWNYGTRAGARAEAMRRCYRRGPRCNIETVFWNKCFAVAFQQRGNGYGWATRDTAQAAEQVAMSGCERHGRDCEIKQSICDETN